MLRASKDDEPLCLLLSRVDPLPHRYYIGIGYAVGGSETAHGAAELRRDPPQSVPASWHLESAAGSGRPGGSDHKSGLSLEEAVKIISGAGFAAAAIETETSRKAPETAIRTNPTAGAPAKPGAHVTLTMSGAPTTVAKSSAASATASPSAGYAS